jgi:hypothetical protein
MKKEGYTPEIDWAMLADVAERQKETTLQIDKLAKSVKRINKNVGGIENSNGDFAEEYFFNSFKQGNHNFFGETFDEIDKNVPGGEPDSEDDDEYDIVLYNCKSIGIVEVKYKARPSNIERTIEKAATFRTVYPQYADHKIYLAIAAMSFHLDTEDKCKKAGIAIVKQVGDKVIIYEDNLTAY